MDQTGTSLPPRPQTNGLAIASLVLGLVGLVTCNCLTVVPGIVLGHIGLSQIRRSGGAQTGRRMAVGGLVTGYITLVLSIMLTVAFIVLMTIGAASHHHR